MNMRRLLSLLWMLLCFITGCNSTDRKSAQPNAGSLRIPLTDNAGEMEASILKHLPVGTALDEVEDFMAEERFHCAKLLPNILTCSAQRDASPWVTKEWIAEIKFKDGRLVDVTVSVHHTGP